MTISKISPDSFYRNLFSSNRRHSSLSRQNFEILNINQLNNPANNSTGLTSNIHEIDGPGGIHSPTGLTSNIHEIDGPGGTYSPTGLTSNIHEIDGPGETPLFTYKLIKENYLKMFSNNIKNQMQNHINKII